MRLSFVILLTFISLGLKSQDFSTLGTIQLKDKEDYAKAEEKVLECCDYILKTPLEKDNLNLLYANQFLIKWMSGTPDFGFDLDATTVNLTKSNSMLMGVYMACMAKYSLEHKETANNKNEVKLNSVGLFLNYCENPQNGIKIKGELKKAVDAQHNNKLKEYLGV